MNPQADLANIRSRIARAVGQIAAAMSTATSTVPQDRTRCAICGRPHCLEPHPTPARTKIVAPTESRVETGVVHMMLQVEEARRQLHMAIEDLDTVCQDAGHPGLIWAPWNTPDTLLAAYTVRCGEQTHNVLLNGWIRRHIDDDALPMLKSRYADVAHQLASQTGRLERWLPPVPPEQRCTTCGYRRIKYAVLRQCGTCYERQRTAV